MTWKGHAVFVMVAFHLGPTEMALVVPCSDTELERLRRDFNVLNADATSTPFPAAVPVTELTGVILPDR